MSTAYEPNIQGAIAVLRDLMIANSFTMTREPYEPNYRGLVDAVIDLKEGFPSFAPLQVGFDATAFENVTEGDALYMRTSDGQVGKLIGSTIGTISLIRNRSYWNFSNLAPKDPVASDLCSQLDLQKAVDKANRKVEREKKKAGKETGSQESQ